jgi:hypothetical protein
MFSVFRKRLNPLLVIFTLILAPRTYQPLSAAPPQPRPAVMALVEKAIQASHAYRFNESTAELMKQSYAHLKRGEAKGASLRAVGLALMKDGQHGHSYWAPFVLMGDWR